MAKDFDTELEELHVALSTADNEEDRDALTLALLNLYRSLEEGKFATA